MLSQETRKSASNISKNCTSTLSSNTNSYCQSRSRSKPYQCQVEYVPVQFPSTSCTSTGFCRTSPLPCVLTMLNWVRSTPISVLLRTSIHSYVYQSPFPHPFVNFVHCYPHPTTFCLFNSSNFGLHFLLEICLLVAIFDSRCSKFYVS